MKKLDDRLDAITHMMDHAEAYGPDEVRTWRVLTHHIDRTCFEHTGKLIVTKLPLDVIAVHTSLSKEAVMEALEQLMRRGYVTVEPYEDGFLRYQLFLFSEHEAHAGLRTAALCHRAGRPAVAGRRNATPSRPAARTR